MGACARRTKKIVKAIGKQLTPIGIALIGDIVGIVATTEWENDVKRETAVDMARGALKARAIEARETAIRATIEVAVSALKDGEDALRELGAADAADVAEMDALA